MDSLKETRDRLRKADYRFVSTTGRLDGTRLEFWANTKQTIILHDSKDNGWEIYVPSCKSNDVEKTWKALGI